MLRKETEKILKRFDSQNASNAETKTYLQKPVNKRIQEGVLAEFEKDKKRKKTGRSNGGNSKHPATKAIINGLSSPTRKILSDFPLVRDLFAKLVAEPSHCS